MERPLRKVSGKSVIWFSDSRLREKWEELWSAAGCDENGTRKQDMQAAEPLAGVCAGTSALQLAIYNLDAGRDLAVQKK